jgi:hypothetical protein
MNKARNSFALNKRPSFVFARRASMCSPSPIIVKEPIVSSARQAITKAAEFKVKKAQVDQDLRDDMINAEIM